MTKLMDRIKLSGEAEQHIAAAITGYIFSGLFIISLPIWVSAVIDDLGISERIGGYLGSLEITCVAIAMLVTSRFVHLINRRRFALIGGLLGIAGNLISAMAETLLMTGIARSIVGLGLGVLLVCTLSTAAGTPKSQSTFSYMEACLAVAASVFYTISAWQLNQSGSTGVFMTIVVVQSVCIPFLMFMPGGNLSGDKMHGKVTGIGKVQWGAILANGLFYVGMFSFWTFVSRIGLSLDLSNSIIGNVLSVAFLASLISTLAVPFLTGRLGYQPVVIWTVVIMGLSGFLLTHATGFLVFAISVVLLKFHFLLHSTMMNGLFAKSDFTGSTNGNGLAVAIIGSSIGPALGGELLGYGGYNLLGWSACFIWLFCLPFLFLLARHVDRNRHPENTRKTDSAVVTTEA